MVPSVDANRMDLEDLEKGGMGTEPCACPTVSGVHWPSIVGARGLLGCLCAVPGPRRTRPPLPALQCAVYTSVWPTTVAWNESARARSKLKRTRLPSTGIAAESAIT